MADKAHRLTDQHRPSIREDFGRAITEYYITIPRTEMFSVFFCERVLTVLTKCVIIELPK